MKKSIHQINEKIKNGSVVVLTAAEVKKLAEQHSPEEILEQVDVVTTATFAPMCSSGAFINFGHSEPAIRMEKITLNNVPVFAGIAAVDAYIGATETSLHRPDYGGAHIIEELIRGENVILKASGKGTDCYPCKEIEAVINKNCINEFIMFNPRNAYQNYCAAINSDKKAKYTYMGCLLPEFGNVTYSTSGELSPLLNDPALRTIGLGTRIFFGGTAGYVAWNGTQFNTSKPKNEFGIPESNAATLAVIGNAKEMNTQFIRVAYFEKYGVTLFVGIGVPIPLLDLEMVKAVCIRNTQIVTTLVDYGKSEKPALGKFNYAELQSGNIKVNGSWVKTAPLSSLCHAQQICVLLQQWIQAGAFELTKPVALFPTNTTLNKLTAK